MNNLVKAYIEGERGAGVMDAEYTKDYDALGDLIRGVGWEMELKQRRIRARKDAIVRRLEGVQREMSQELKVKMERQLETVEKVERILEFLRLKTEKRDIGFDVNGIKNYRDKYIECIGAIYNDAYLHLVAYVYENDKPKNKYTLCAVGKCLFDNKELGFDRCYGLHLMDHDVNPGIEEHLRDAPTVDELKAWFRARLESGKLFKEQLERYRAVKMEYEDAVKKYTVDDFAEILVFRCHGCGFFVTERQKERYSWRDGCPQCQGGVIT